jgi:hypothetical protein
MERARTTFWTDERLDDFAPHVDVRFDRLEEDIRGLRTEARSDIGALQRMVLQVGAGVIATMLVGFASLVAAQLA